jgi:hypothetical protein
MHFKVEPLLYYWRGLPYGKMNVKVFPSEMSTAIKSIEI